MTEENEEKLRIIEDRFSLGLDDLSDAKWLIAEVRRLTTALDEAEVTKRSLLTELWDGVKAHGLKAHTSGRDGERLIHAYCGGIVEMRLENERLTAELTEVRRVADASVAYLKDSQWAEQWETAVNAYSARKENR